MCTRTRKNQWWITSLCSGTLPPPAIRISRERDQTVEKEASTCCRYGLASSAGVGAIAPAKKSFCAPPTDDQARGRIAFVLLRMPRPGARGQRLHLRPQALRVEADRQAKEWLR